jgi:hypothetical protein
MYHSQNGWNVISNNVALLKYGFIKKEGYFYKKINENQNITAFTKNTFCTYKKGLYEIGNIFQGKVILFPDLETKRKLGIYINDDNSIDVNYDKFIEEVEEIWEERTPIEGFKFDVEPIYYIKRK